MKSAFLSIAVVALLVPLGLAQTPAATPNPDQTNIKGCLGGSDGNYSVVEDNTGHLFKITASSFDLKPHLGHDVALIAHKASGVSPAAADSSFAVTELSMISDHCAAAAVAPAATVTTPAETATTPAAGASGVICALSPILWWGGSLAAANHPLHVAIGVYLLPVFVRADHTHRFKRY